jgi:hypothetical protein
MPIEYARVSTLDQTLASQRFLQFSANVDEHARAGHCESWLRMLRHPYQLVSLAQAQS